MKKIKKSPKTKKTTKKTKKYKTETMTLYSGQMIDFRKKGLSCVLYNFGKKHLSVSVNFKVIDEL